MESIIFDNNNLNYSIDYYNESIEIKCMYMQCP